MSNINLFPEKIVKTKDSEGKKYTSEVYRMDTIANLSMFSFLFIAIMVGVFLPLLPISLIVIYMLLINDRDSNMQYLIIGALISLYLFHDIENGWIASAFIQFAYGKKWMSLVYSTSLATTTLSMFLLFFGNTIYRTLRRTWLILSAIFIFTVFMVISESASIYEKTPKFIQEKQKK
jgi:hypothetical protein